MAGTIDPGVVSSDVAVAGRTDDASLRSMLRHSTIPGAVRVAFTREPDYFAADGMAGGDDITVVARRDGHVVGSGRCSIYSLMRNGLPRRIGYLSVLRVAASTPRSARLVREGFELLGREVLPRADGFFTSIATDNARARRVLESGTRLGLPAYHPLCDLVTLIAPVRGTGSLADAPPSESELGAFLAEDAQRYQLTLTWDATVWSGLRRHGVSSHDFAVVRRGNQIGAAAAVWDQRTCRQTVVEGYEGMLGAFRPLVNAVFAIRRHPRLPPRGTVLAQGAIFGASVRDPRDWPALWRQLQARAAARGLSWLAISRDVRDPELSILKRLTRGREYRTTLYEVVWPGGTRWTEPWDTRCFRPEVALL